MFVIRTRKDTQDNKFVPIFVRDTKEHAEDILLQQLCKLDAKPKPTEIVENGIYYETIGDITTVRKYTVTIIPAGFFSYESKEIKHDWICDFDIEVIPKDVDDEYLDYQNIIYPDEEEDEEKITEFMKDLVIEVLPSNNFTSVNISHKIKTTDENLSFSSSYHNAMYTKEELDNIPDGTIMDVEDKNGKWFVAKILRSQIIDGTKHLRVHFNNWSPSFNEYISIDEPKFAKKHTYTFVEYTDEPIDEYFLWDDGDYAKLVEIGLCLSLEEFKNLKQGDVIEFCWNREARKFERFVVVSTNTAEGVILVHNVDNVNYEYHYRLFMKKGTFIKD